MQQFYAHGKLLISGEYLVLKGAMGLAVPTKFGQRMEVTDEPGDDHYIHWQSFDKSGNKWIEATFAKSDLQIKKSSNPGADEKAIITLQKILRTIRKRNAGFLKLPGKTIITNHLEFDTNWGLGSSSTLISNLAKYANIDAFTLNTEIFNGSGYDIACAQSSMPIFYKIDDEGIVFDSVHFNPPQSDQMLFVHLGNKQDSKIAVESFLKEGNIAKKFANEIEVISEISEALLFCDDFVDFMQLLDEHEEVMQYVLQEEKIKSARFNDFDGVVKSLGAWGGDFILAVADMETKQIADYFKDKGYHTQVPYNEMVL